MKDCRFKAWVAAAVGRRIADLGFGAAAVGWMIADSGFGAAAVG